MNYAELIENICYMGALTWAVWLVSEWLCRPIPIDED